MCDSSISENTRNAYITGFRTFCNFLPSIGIRADDFRPTPITEQTLIYFVTHCFKALRLSINTIKLYLAAVRFFYVKAGVHCPWSTMNETCPRLHTVLRGIKKQSNTREKRRPITYYILCQLHSILKQGRFGKFIDTMLMSACSLAFFAFLRCGEFTIQNGNQDNMLSLTDITMDSHENKVNAFTLVLKSSKTDPFRQGISIRIFKSGNVVCPVNSMVEYLKIRKTWTNGRESPALFIEECGTPLTRNSFVSKLKQLLHSLGYKDEKYNGHSFRIGAATSAASGNVEDHMIKTLGRWRSDCYNRYIRTDDDTLSRAQQAMCNK